MSLNFSSLERIKIFPKITIKQVLNIWIIFNNNNNNTWNLCKTNNN